MAQTENELVDMLCCPHCGSSIMYDDAVMHILSGRVMCNDCGKWSNIAALKRIKRPLKGIGYWPAKPKDTEKQIKNEPTE